MKLDIGLFLVADQLSEIVSFHSHLNQHEQNTDFKKIIEALLLTLNGILGESPTAKDRAEYTLNPSGSGLKLSRWGFSQDVSEACRKYSEPAAIGFLLENLTTLVNSRQDEILGQNSKYVPRAMRAIKSAQEKIERVPVAEANIQKKEDILSDLAHHSADLEAILRTGYYKYSLSDEETQLKITQAALHTAEEKLRLQESASKAASDRINGLEAQLKQATKALSEMTGTLQAALETASPILATIVTPLPAQGKEASASFFSNRP